MTAPKVDSQPAIPQSPFAQLRQLLNGIAPGLEPEIQLTIGEPREAMPSFVADAIHARQAEFAKYPPITGTDELRGSIATWIKRRYPHAEVDAGKHVLPLAGSREGLFYACQVAARLRASRKTAAGSAIAMCNPYYSAYYAGAVSAGSEPVLLNTTPATGHLPDLERLAGDHKLLERLNALFIASPANPQGAVASPAYIKKALQLARTHNFMLFLDECYSEIYCDEAPPGGLDVAAGDYTNLVVFNSLSKRSNLPGIRSGFAAGDPQFLSVFSEFRNLCAPTIPLPLQHASALAWQDEAHVEAARAAYREKFEIADRLLKDRFDYRRPAGGFCLWLNMSRHGGDLEAAVTLWKRAGVKVIPGRFLAQPDQEGVNPGENFIRLALVQHPATIEEALQRTITVLR